MTPEFSRLIDRRQITAAPLTLSANEAERAALAARFGLVRVDRLEATVTLAASGDRVEAKGTLDAAWVQPCAISAEDLPQQAQEKLSLRFVHAATIPDPDEEIELSAEDADEVEYSGHSFDLGEALAQSLALAIDPFATGPQAEAARKKAGLSGEDASGPFAGLAGLRAGLKLEK